MTLRALLVDDEPPARTRLRRLLSDHPDIECIGEAGDGNSALSQIEELSPDILFLDIDMPSKNGLEVAAALPDSGPAIIYVTAYDTHALRAFELAAVDYLLKPVSKDRLRSALDRVRARRAGSGVQPVGTRSLIDAMESRVSPKKMAVRTGAKYFVFDVDRVAAAVAADHYVTLYVDGKELLSEESLDEIANRLGTDRFLRTHRSAVVNVEFVRELVRQGDRKFVAIIEFGSGIEVPISRERLDDVKARLGVRG